MERVSEASFRAILVSFQFIEHRTNKELASYVLTHEHICVEAISALNEDLASYKI